MYLTFAKSKFIKHFLTNLYSVGPSQSVLIRTVDLSDDSTFTLFFFLKYTLPKYLEAIV